MRTSQTAVVVVVVAVGIVAVSAACGSSSNVGTASCSACTGASYSAGECQAWGAAAGCKTSTFLATVAGCNNGCSFSDCDVSPQCGGSLGTKDAALDTGADVVDPACSKTTTGLFTVAPPCADFTTVTINGIKNYACKCAPGACPCNFVCGSISLSTGGVVSSVCAPQ